MVYAEFGGKQSVLWAIGKQRIDGNTVSEII